MWMICGKDLTKRAGLSVLFQNIVYRKDKLDDMKPQKLLNYVLQNLETAMNVRILWDIFKSLRNRKTKLVLYTYDSFLFDFKEGEEDLIK